jgi:hypothetical protein
MNTVLTEPGHTVYDTSRVVLVFRAQETRVTTSHMSWLGQWRRTLLMACSGFRRKVRHIRRWPEIYAFSTHNIFMSFVWFSQWTAITSHTQHLYVLCNRSAVLFCEVMIDFVSRHLFVFKMSMRYSDTTQKNGVTPKINICEVNVILWWSERGFLKLIFLKILSHPGVAWLIRRVLDLMLEFLGPLYNWLKQFVNHYLTHCHLRVDTRFLTTFHYSVVLLRTPLFSDCSLL